MAGRPAEPEVIWARPERAGRGPAPAYTRTDIAAAAVGIADADGLDAVSMRRVAGQLGCGTMSLYNYVPRKEDLYELMLDHVSAEYDLTGPSGDWRADMLDLGRQARGILRRHPWLIRVMSTGYAQGPNALRFLEHGLACLADLDLAGGAKMELLASVNGTVMTVVSSELAVSERSRGLPWPPEREQEVRAAYLGKALATGEYPHLAEVFATADPPPDPDEMFERTLRRVIDSFA
ncbi:TetR/AcrR family transcriptional regulator C-terminal domain-containing protein [Streptomyces sp. NPDC001941]|uniref:TetR/AcrR family transcriptional regulator C-terminal domain-containing protein n=1 Tax=Streptomyces sp. NPDC001941 TaxID=3154659 RepID=UPI0033219F72